VDDRELSEGSRFERMGLQQVASASAWRAQEHRETGDGTRRIAESSVALSVYGSGGPRHERNVGESDFASRALAFFFGVRSGWIFLGFDLRAILRRESGERQKLGETSCTIVKKCRSVPRSVARFSRGGSRADRSQEKSNRSGRRRKTARCPGTRSPLSPDVPLGDVARRFR